MPTSRRTAMKKCQTKAQCFRCWFKRLECLSGTLSGNCIHCGVSRSQNVFGSFGGFFNETLIALMSRIAAHVSLPLGCDNSYYNILEIHNTTTTGLSEPHVFEVHGDYDPSNTNLQYPIDQMVWLSYTSNIREKNAATDLVTKAIFVRGYLTLLFATNVTERVRVLRDGLGEYKTIVGSNLSVHLTNFILFRLNGLIFEIMDVILRNDHSGGEAQLLDISAASAVLITGLMDTNDGLLKGRLKPLCGGIDLANALGERILATTMQIEPHLCCKSDWAAHLKEPLERMRTGIIITNMVLTLETRFHNIPNASPESSLSTIFDVENTPASSTDQQSPPDSGVGDSVASSSPGRLSFTGSIVSDAPVADLSFLAAGAAGEMASQASNPFGFTPWNHWAEQNNDTWRQS